MVPRGGSRRPTGVAFVKASGRSRPRTLWRTSGRLGRTRDTAAALAHRSAGSRRAVSARGRRAGLRRGHAHALCSYSQSTPRPARLRVATWPLRRGNRVARIAQPNTDCAPRPPPLQRRYRTTARPFHQAGTIAWRHDLRPACRSTQADRRAIAVRCSRPHAGRSSAPARAFRGRARGGTCLCAGARAGGPRHPACRGSSRIGMPVRSQCRRTARPRRHGTPVDREHAPVLSRQCSKPHATNVTNVTRTQNSAAPQVLHSRGNDAAMPGLWPRCSISATWIPCSTA
jgi:hypothetical protein